MASVSVLSLRKEPDDSASLDFLPFCSFRGISLFQDLCFGFGFGFQSHESRPPASLLSSTARMGIAVPTSESEQLRLGGSGSSAAASTSRIGET